MKKQKINFIFLLAIGLLFSTFSTSVFAEYFMFRFVVSDSGGTSYTEWMDERLSNTITIENRSYMSCDKVTLQLRPIDGVFGNHGWLWEVFLLDDDMKLRREYADKSNPDMYLSWSLASPDWLPDTGTTFRTDATGQVADFKWDLIWPDSYWFVKYKGDSNNVFRTRVRFKDGDDMYHYLYAKPVASNAVDSSHR